MDVDLQDLDSMGALAAVLVLDLEQRGFDVSQIGLVIRGMAHFVAWLKETGRPSRLSQFTAGHMLPFLLWTRMRSPDPDADRRACAALHPWGELLVRLHMLPSNPLEDVLVAASCRVAAHDAVHEVARGSWERATVLPRHLVNVGPDLGFRVSTERWMMVDVKHA